MRLIRLKVLAQVDVCAYSPPLPNAVQLKTAVLLAPLAQTSLGREASCICRDVVVLVWCYPTCSHWHSGMLASGCAVFGQGFWSTHVNDPTPSIWTTGAKARWSMRLRRICGALGVQSHVRVSLVPLGVRDGVGVNLISNCRVLVIGESRPVDHRRHNYNNDGHRVAI